eukprot:3064545-Ditylum_brightwellii.AAC.1
MYKITEKYINQVSTKHYRQSVKYRQEVTAQIQQKQKGETAKQLIKDKTTTIEKIEDLDKEVTKIMLQSEKKMPKLLDFWWSPDLHAKCLICRYLKIIASLERNRLHGKATLEEIGQQFPVDNNVYQGEADCPTIYQ